MFCVLCCNMTPAHHILPASSAEEVSAAATSSGVGCGICPHRQARRGSVLISVVFFFTLLSRSAFALVSERERAVPRPPPVVPHRVGHAETLPRPPHPPGVGRLR